jgi:hypothetical protein
MVAKNRPRVDDEQEDLPIWRPFIGGAACPVGEAYTRGEALLEITEKD